MAGISASPCPEPSCRCGCVIVRLHDAAGKILSGVVLPRETAAAFRDHLGAAIDGRADPAPNHLRSIRREGTA